MSDQFEITVRMGSFLCIFLLMTFWEVLSPRRQLAVRKRHRWASNLSLVALNTVLVRLIIPITTVGAAIAADARGWGLLQLIDLEAKKGDEAHCRDAHNELRPIFLPIFLLLPSTVVGNSQMGITIPRAHSAAVIHRYTACSA